MIITDCWRRPSIADHYRPSLWQTLTYDDCSWLLMTIAFWGDCSHSPPQLLYGAAEIRSDFWFWELADLFCGWKDWICRWWEKSYTGPLAIFQFVYLSDSFLSSILFLCLSLAVFKYFSNSHFYLCSQSLSTKSLSPSHYFAVAFSISFSLSLPIFPFHFFFYYSSYILPKRRLNFWTFVSFYPRQSVHAQTLSLSENKKNHCSWREFSRLCIVLVNMTDFESWETSLTLRFWSKTPTTSR